MVIMVNTLLTSSRVLVTRPSEQAQPLAEMIRHRQGHACILPMLTITPANENQAMRNILLSLDQYDKIIVTSHHAALFGYELIDRYWPQLPVDSQWYAIGAKTAQTLTRFDISTQTPTQGATSEALLAMDDLSEVSGTRVLIIKGLGGRQLLEDTLKAIGAHVDCLNVYQRQAPEYPTNTLPDTLNQHKINTILCASGETVTNLIASSPHTDFSSYNLVVPSQRIANLIQHNPFKTVVVADDASNQAMLAALETLELNNK